MFDLFVTLLIVFVILLIVQIVALIRLRFMIKQFRKLLDNFNWVVANVPLPVLKKRNCRHCKFRQTFIKTTSTGEQDDFYYRCKLHDINIALNQYCPDFNYDPQK